MMTNGKYRRDIYVLEGLAPEVKAVTFAKCSRSPKSFKKIARELNEESSSKFHEKWVVGYGHSSVAEHAVLSLAMENISILATKVVEDCRLASFTEKSTRYQVFDRERYYRPKKLMDLKKFGSLYEKTANSLFDAYAELTPRFIEFFKKKSPLKNNENPKIYETICKARALDVVRYLLPAATLTNLGMTINARSLEYAISKFLSHSLEEIREIGREIKKVSLKVTPTLIKYANFCPFFEKTSQALEKVAGEMNLESAAKSRNPAVVLVDYDREAENKIVSSLLYRFSKSSYREILKRVKKLSLEKKTKIIDEAMRHRGPHDRPLREFEHVYYTFDILVDFGAFRDIQRHRICTQTNQEFNCEHGYAMPREFSEAGYERMFVSLMEAARQTFNEIYKEFPNEAPYILPLAYKKRVLITWNLRELHHFISLRSGARGHVAYRYIAHRIFDEIKRVHPLLANHIIVHK